MIILKTQRCELRTFTTKDAENLFPILSSKKVMQYSMSGPLNLSATKTLIKEWISLYRKTGFSPWAVIHNNHMIGYAGFDLRIADNIEKTQITFRLSESYWGKGLATEIVHALKNYGLNKLKLSEIIAITDPQNIASINTIQKIGMTFEKEIVYGGLLLNMYQMRNT